MWSSLHGLSVLAGVLAGLVPLDVPTAPESTAGAYLLPIVIVVLVIMVVVLVALRAKRRRGGGKGAGS